MASTASKLHLCQTCAELLTLHLRWKSFQALQQLSRSERWLLLASDLDVVFYYRYHFFQNHLFLGRNMLESLESHGFFWLLICNYPTTTQELPEAKDSPQVCGKTANGCRLAFDLGKSDIKTVAVKDGEAHLGRGLRWSDDNSSLQQLARADISISFIILDDQEVQRLSFVGDASWCSFDFDFGPITSRICDDSGISQYHHNLLNSRR